VDDVLAITADAGPSDRQLVERTLSGDAEAFAALHRRYFGRIYRIALYRCRNQQDAEDIASETFVKAIAHLGSFRFQGESIFPWLSRIATNLAVDQGRRASGMTLVSLDTPTADSVRALIEGLAAGPGAPDPHALAERAETQAIVRAAVATLPADQGEAVLLRFGSDMPLKEIAAVMGRSEGAIKSLLHRALVNLRKALLTTTGAAEVFGQRRETSAAQHTVDPTSAQARTTEKRYGDL
jgi:RNA polymerase sigma factor, sigma-70 family